MTQSLANTFACKEISFHEITWNQIHQLFTKLVVEMMQSSNFDRDLLQRCNLIITCKLEGGKNARLAMETESEQFRIYTWFNSLLNENFSRLKKVEDYSEAIGISSRKITTACYRYTGRSAKTLIEERLLSESMLDLRAQNLPIKTIALSLGFSDQYQFSKFFKKHTAVNPTEFRRKLGQLK